MELMDRGITDETGTTVGKTIVFCATQNHAEAMKQLLDELYPIMEDDWVKSSPHEWNEFTAKVVF